MPTTVVDSLIKVKKSDGSFEITHPFTKSANVKTEEAISVMLSSPVGSFKNGDTIEADTSVTSIIKKLLQEQIPPTYTSPSAKLTASGNAAGSFEAGTSLSPTITCTFTKGDAGDISSNVITKNGTEVANTTNLTTSYEDSFVIGAETITYKGTVSYGDGVVKNDNFGEPYDATSIKAGSVTTSELKYTGYRTWFYGATSATAAPTASAEIRALNKGTAAAAAGKTFSISVAKGQQAVIFAYPATLRDVNSVKYVEAGNDESKLLFTQTTIDVEGASGYEATSYKVYYMIGEQPFPAAMTFNVTI